MLLFTLIKRKSRANICQVAVFYETPKVYFVRATFMFVLEFYFLDFVIRIRSIWEGKVISVNLLTGGPVAVCHGTLRGCEWLAFD